MGGEGSRRKRQAKREWSVGPSRSVVCVSVDHKLELLECGHVLVDAPLTPNKKVIITPRARRCVQCHEDASSAIQT